mmetsp:Transcript_90624/g.157044  ORF Transcript_90624/g.157044 Transcript_90624/m.157044 type:complete len:86 (-) Transcript_90624:234-491(-)
MVPRKCLCQTNGGWGGVGSFQQHNTPIVISSVDNVQRTYHNQSQDLGMVFNDIVTIFDVQLFMAGLQLFMGCFMNQKKIAWTLSI